MCTDSTGGDFARLVASAGRGVRMSRHHTETLFRQWNSSTESEWYTGGGHLVRSLARRMMFDLGELAAPCVPIRLLSWRLLGVAGWDVGLLRVDLLPPLPAKTSGLRVQYLGSPAGTRAHGAAGRERRRTRDVPPAQLEHTLQRRLGRFDLLCTLWGDSSGTPVAAGCAAPGSRQTLGLVLVAHRNTEKKHTRQ